MLTIVACGGNGTRMLPVTKWVNKHLIPIGKDQLMIDMPIEFLSKHKKIKEITVVTGSNHASQICDYIQDGEKYGFERVEYAFQPKPLGIADVLKRVSHKNVDEGVLLILGDNYFSEVQASIINLLPSNYAFAWEYDLGNPSLAKSFGQAIRNEKGICEIVEKPDNPTHAKILTGLYYFPSDVFELVRKLTPSQRGELEITDLLRMYLKMNRFNVWSVVGKWSDLGEQIPWANFVATRR